MRCALRYGKNGLEVSLPDSWNVTVVSRRPLPAARHPAACIEAALSSPAGAEDLAREARGAASACIMICDSTRPVPNHLILRPLIERLLGAGLSPKAITVLVATGLHRPNEKEELASVVGDPWVAEHAVIANHFARQDDAHVMLGTTSQGVPVSIDRRVVDADVRVAVGLVEPHFMAGWSGGRKLVLPGCAGADTIMAFHSARMLEDPKAEACSLDGNPLHEAQGEALRMLGKTLAVSVVINDARELAFASYGGAEESLAAAVAFAELYVRVGLPAAFPVVLSTGAGFPLDSTYYQTVKGFCTGASILEPGGDLFVASNCAEGFGSRDFRASQERLCRGGKEAFRAESRRKARAAVDEWETVMLLKALDVGRVHLYSEGLSTDEHALTGAVPVNDLLDDLRAAVERAAGCRLAVIPEGPYAAPFIQPGPAVRPATRGRTRANGRAP
jgi:nickel-dependent lactate racemase